MIMTRRSLDYQKNFQVEFGAYVQANNEPQPLNALAPCMINCIYLHPMNNIQEGHELMDLRTGHLITHHKVIPIPITQSVIDIVEHMVYVPTVHF